jgi:hypothetical protein
MNRIRWAAMVVCTVVGVVLSAAMGFGVMTPTAHADYYNYPCSYPFVGMSADINFVVDAGGQFCDGLMEINGSHYHCESGGANVNLGALAIAPVGPGGIGLGGFGGSGIGGRGGSCTFRCPDNTVTVPPDPPFAWAKPLTVSDAHNDCRDHMTPAGIWSTPQAPPGTGGVLPDPQAPDPPAPPLPQPLGDDGDQGGVMSPGSPLPLP